MRTAQKIIAAKILYRTIKMARRALRHSDRIITKKDGVNYELDLSEGIDLAIYLFGGFEPSTRDALARYVKPGMTVLDIGANIGSHTLHLANLVGATGHVYAFEPTAFAFAKLKRNLSLNPVLAQRVVLQQCFLTGEDFSDLPQEIYSSWPLLGGRDLHPEHLGAKKGTNGARARTLDGVLADNGNPVVDVVKLDVDGVECDVLNGAITMISLHKPIFVMELAPYLLKERGHSLEEMMSFFIPLGYRFFHHRTEKPLPSDAAAISRMIRVGESVNVIVKCQK